MVKEVMSMCMMCAGIAVILLALAAGYLVLLKADKAEGKLKKIGKIIGWVIVVVTALSLLWSVKMTMFCKGKGWCAASSSAFICYSNLEFQNFVFVRRQLKHKVFRKTPIITLYSFIQIPGGYAVQFRQIGIQHHFLLPDQVNRSCNAFNGNDTLKFVHAASPIIPTNRSNK